jgi:hypothetical protein
LNEKDAVFIPATAANFASDCSRYPDWIKAIGIETNNALDYSIRRAKKVVSTYECAARRQYRQAFARIYSSYE